MEGVLAWPASLQRPRYTTQNVSHTCSDKLTECWKCDLARPACGRCVEQGLNCSGVPLDDVFVFRDENEVAKRNSQRARGPQGWKAFTPLAASSSSLVVLQNAPNQIPGDAADGSLQRQYSWLNEYALTQVPEPLKRDVETRAVERFFINWILHPSNDGGTPGEHSVHFQL